MPGQALKTATRESPLLDEELIWRLVHLPDRRTKRGRRDAALLSLLTLAGLRSHEASALKVDQIDPQPDGTARILSEGKGGKERTITLPLPGSDFLLRWIAYTGSKFWVFPSRRGEPLTDKEVRHVVKGYGAALGFPTARDADGVDRSLHPHALRHSALTCLVRSSGDMYLTQRTAGHSDPRVTARYYLKISPRDADTAARFISEALRRRKPRGRPRKAVAS